MQSKERRDNPFPFKVSNAQVTLISSRVYEIDAVVVIRGERKEALIFFHLVAISLCPPKNTSNSTCRIRTRPPWWPRTSLQSLSDLSLPRRCIPLPQIEGQSSRSPWSSCWSSSANFPQPLSSSRPRPKISERGTSDILLSRLASIS